MNGEDLSVMPFAKNMNLDTVTRRTFDALLGACLIALCVMLVSGPVRAALTIEIVGHGERQIPIAIAPLQNEGSLPDSISRVVAADLARSGLFRMIDPGGVTPTPSEPEQVRFGDWSGRGADALVIGTVSPTADGRIEVRFRLMDVFNRSQMAGFSYNITASQARQTAHRIADVIYEKLTGAPGAFATRITYVVKQGGRFELHVADADGANPQIVLASAEPIISPAWSPDGTRLAYVSFERKKPIIYVQTLASGQRQVVANFKGSNSSPAWAPDGRRLAVVLTRDGSSQIYLINVDGSGLTRLTNSAGIDTEPSFSPDGQWLLFTSDRGGSPQVYRVSVNGGQPERLTFDGTYNVSPRVSPDGQRFVFVQRSGGRFSLQMQEIGNRQVIPLTDGGVDESPTFSPNGRMILYASQVRGRGILAGVSSDGTIKQRLSVNVGDVREPAWGPLPRNN
jgi:TolB protein